MAMSDVSLEHLGNGCSLVVQEGDYYGAKVMFAGEVKKLEMEGGAATP